MSSFIAPFYSSDLEAMTALVLNRSQFLDSVTDAVTYEDKMPDAAKMVSVLEKNAFLSLIPAFLTDADTSIRKKAYLALGNLIASDNRAVAEVAFKSAYGAFLTKKFDFANDAHGVAYVLGNMALRIKQWPEFYANNLDICVTDILLYAKCHLTADLPSPVKHDLLWIFRQLDCAWMLTASRLIELLNQKEKKTFRTALYLLGELVSADICPDDTVTPVYNYLEEALAKQVTPFKTKHEHLWMLSNLVLEDGVAKDFFDDQGFFDVVANVIRLDKDERSVIEAVYVIVNCLTRVPPRDLTHFRLLEVQDLLTIFLDHEFGRANFRTEVRDMLDKVNESVTARYVPVEVPRTDDDESTVYEETGMDMEIDYEASWVPTGSEQAEAEIYAQAQPPCELPSFTIYNPPSAFELLRKRTVYEFTSATVYNLITALEANNLAFTPIPEGTTLTVEDLKILETRGFVIVRGSIGINPALTLAFYGTH